MLRCFKSKWINFWLFNICMYMCWWTQKMHLTLHYSRWNLLDTLHAFSYTVVVPKCAGYWEFCVHSFSRISTEYFAHEVWLNNSFPAAQNGKRLKLTYIDSRIHLTVYKTACNICTCSFSFVGKRFRKLTIKHWNVPSFQLLPTGPVNQGSTTFCLLLLLNDTQVTLTFFKLWYKCQFTVIIEFDVWSNLT